MSRGRGKKLCEGITHPRCFLAELRVTRRVTPAGGALALRFLGGILLRRREL